MFKLVQPTFARAVTVKVPVDGGFERQTMQVTYRVLPISETEVLLSEDREGIKNYVSRLVDRIDDLEDENGAQLDWNNEVRDQLFDLPHVFSAILDGYKDTMEEARVKN